MKYDLIVATKTGHWTHAAYRDNNGELVTRCGAKATRVLVNAKAPGCHRCA